MLRDVRNAARNVGSGGCVRLRSALSNLRSYFEQVKPRTIRLCSRLPPIIILSDAAAEVSGASLGAVFIDPAMGTYEFFGKRICDEMVKKWKMMGRDQVICQAELVAAPLALATWAAQLANRDLIFFIDNDPAREALIKGASAATDSARYAHACRIIGAECAAACWYARVASPSNLADHPSRGDLPLLKKAGATWTEPAPLSCEPELSLFDF